MMLCLIFAGPLAIAAIFSIGATGAYFAFAMPVAMVCLPILAHLSDGCANLTHHWRAVFGFHALSCVANRYL